MQQVSSNATVKSFCDISKSIISMAAKPWQFYDIVTLSSLLATCEGKHGGFPWQRIHWCFFCFNLHKLLNFKSCVKFETLKFKWQHQNGNYYPAPAHPSYIWDRKISKIYDNGPRVLDQHPLRAKPSPCSNLSTGLVSLWDRHNCCSRWYMTQFLTYFMSLYVWNDLTKME